MSLKNLGTLPTHKNNAHDDVKYVQNGSRTINTKSNRMKIWKFHKEWKLYIIYVSIIFHVMKFQINFDRILLCLNLKKKSLKQISKHSTRWWTVSASTPSRKAINAFCRHLIMPTLNESFEQIVSWLHFDLSDHWRALATLHGEPRSSKHLVPPRPCFLLGPVQI